tara:strand:+ start:53 stop:640 length:588 start_codon:yes stop_codon:yes gene_type:complete
MNTVYTIGYGNLEVERFIKLLKDNNIEVLCDIRSLPYSRFNPDFSQDILEISLRKNSIKYIFMGNELGGRSDDPNCYDENDQIDYEKYAETDVFKKGLERLLGGIDKYVIALMCSEKDPERCHRSLLVARFLKEKHSNIKHIHHDLSVETHGDFEQRIVKTMDKNASIFGDEESLNQTYKKLTKKAGHKKTNEKE